MKTKSNLIVGLISVVIIVTVLLTIYMPPLQLKNSHRFDNLPFYNALFNGMSFIALVSAYLFIKNGNVKWHVRMIFTAVLFTLFFLVSYLFYHFTHEPTPYGGKGISKVLYLFILGTHIILAASMLPFIMLAIKEALTKNYQRHKKIAKWAMPMWLYVSFTGVLVYLLNSPYY